MTGLKQKQTSVNSPLIECYENLHKNSFLKMPVHTRLPHTRHVSVKDKNNHQVNPAHWLPVRCCDDIYDVKSRGKIWDRFRPNTNPVPLSFQAAFECMYTLLDSCLDRLDIFQFLNHVEDGLRDHYDIKMLTYLMLVRLASLCPSAVLQSKATFCLIVDEPNILKKDNLKAEWTHL